MQISRLLLCEKKDNRNEERTAVCASFCSPFRDGHGTSGTRQTLDLTLALSDNKIHVISIISHHISFKVLMRYRDMNQL